MKNFPLIPASKNSISNRSLVCGAGVNDANYHVQPVVDGKQLICPYYRRWHSMLKRCYDPRYQALYPTYIGCTVVKEWLNFMAFRAWMMKQDWTGNQLDKDLLITGNKIYSPESCVFISGHVNSLLCDSAAIRGQWPQGVSFYKKTGKFRAQININAKVKSLGYYLTSEEAESAYLIEKAAEIRRHANLQEDPRLVAALYRIANEIE
jgi:hypothetical protein